MSPIIRSSSSPAVDKGIIAVIDDEDFPEVDLAGNVRIADGSGNGTARIDLGAYEYQP